MNDDNCRFWFCGFCTSEKAPEKGISRCRGIKDCDVYEFAEIINEYHKGEFCPKVKGLMLCQEGYCSSCGISQGIKL